MVGRLRGALEALYVLLKAVILKRGSSGYCGLEHPQMRTVGDKSHGVKYNHTLLPYPNTHTHT